MENLRELPALKYLTLQNVYGLGSLVLENQSDFLPQLKVLDLRTNSDQPGDKIDAMAILKLIANQPNHNLVKLAL